MTTCKFAYMLNSDEKNDITQMTLPAVICHNSAFGEMRESDAWKSLAAKSDAPTAGYRRFLENAERKIGSISHRNDLKHISLSDNDGQCMYCWGTTTSDINVDTEKDKDHVFWCIGMGTKADVGGYTEHRTENLAKHIASPSECNWDPQTGDSNCNRSVNRDFDCPR